MRVLAFVPAYACARDCMGVWVFGAHVGRVIDRVQKMAQVLVRSFFFQTLVAQRILMLPLFQQE